MTAPQPTRRALLATAAALAAGATIARTPLPAPSPDAALIDAARRCSALYDIATQCWGVDDSAAGAACDQAAALDRVAGTTDAVTLRGAAAKIRRLLADENEPDFHCDWHEPSLRSALATIERLAGGAS
jgi:hypothetical protein